MTSTLPSRLGQFVRAHDDMPAFHAAYFVLSLLAAALLNLGAFAVLIAVHMALDAAKHAGKDNRLVFVLRDSLVDIALFLTGLVFALYLHPAGGLVALSGLLRAESSIVRAIGMLVPRFALLRHAGREIAVQNPYLPSVWSGREKIALAAIAACVVLVALAPALGLHGAAFTHILREQLTPWNL
jgi:hypothetical protein